MNQGPSIPAVSLRVRNGLALLAGGLATLALIATLLGAPQLAALGLGLVPMAPLAALEVLLLVATLLLHESRPGTRFAGRLAQGLVLVVTAVTAAGLLGHLQGVQTGLDHWLVQRWPAIQLTSLLTDLSLFAVAAALLPRWPVKAAWPLRQGMALAALVPAGIGLVVLISYAAGAPLLYGSGHIPMSLPSALCTLALGLAVLLDAGWDSWPLAAFRPGPRGSRWTLFGSSTGPLVLFLGLGALLLTGGSFFLRHQMRETQSKVLDELQAIADLKARQISDWYGERRLDSEQAAQGALIQTRLRQFLAGSPLAPPAGDVQGWMQALQRSKYQRIVLVDRQGRIRLSVSSHEPSGAAVLNPSDLQVALAARQVQVHDLQRDPGGSEIHMDFWVPIGPGASGRGNEGALLLQVDPRQELFPLVESWPTTSASAESLLVRREGGDVLFLNELRHQSQTALTLRQSLAATPERPATRAVLGAEGLLEGTDYRGHAVLSVLKRIPGTDWRLVTKVDTSEIYAPLRWRVWLGTAGLLGLLALLVAGLGWLLRHQEAELTRQQLSLSQRFEWLMREANDIILLLDQDGRILEANARAVEAYGYTLAELVGMPVLELREPTARAEGRDQYAQLLSRGSLRFETLNQRKDGSTFPVEVNFRALQLDGEQRAINIVRDISARRAQEHEILRMTQLYSALSQVNQSIVWSNTQQDLFDRICQVMVEFGRFSMAWIALDDPDSHTVSVAARCGDAKGYLEQVRIESGLSPLGKGPIGLAIREGQPVLENDFLAATGTEPWHEAAAACGFLAVAAFPIRQGGQVIGALAVYAGERGFFGDQETALLVEAAMDISFALDHLAGEAQRQKAEVALLESQRLLREAQEAGAVGAYTWYLREDRWISSSYLDEIFGIGPEYPRDLAGWVELIEPEFRENMNAYVTGIIQRHERFDLDYPIVRATDGAHRWVHGQGDIQRDDQDHPVALVGVIHDITERKQTEQSLRKISAAVEQSPLAIMITDSKGMIEYVNPAFTLTSGYSAEEAIGQNPRFLKSPLAPPEMFKELWRTLARGEIWVGEFENVRKSGESYIERATVAPVRDADGSLVGYIALKDDITASRQHEAERRSLEAQLHQAQKLESLGSLAGGVAHDMNNVLGAVMGLASTMRESVEPSSVSAKSLDTIVNACLRGRGVVKSLLYFAKKDLQEERPLDLNELTREMNQLLSHTTLKRIQLQLDLQEDIGLLQGDPGALSHALMNLCVNAIDAMSSGGTLSLRTRQGSDGGLVLSVVDTGSGMPPEVLAKAMEPFFTTKAQDKGTGLGLAMVYGTMMAHEGTFELVSEPGRGTEALLSFPASRVLPRVPSAAVTPAILFAGQKALQVLLVDDDELIREAVTSLLEMLGHTVATAPGGSQALELVQSGRPVDLVILDMNMPGLSGGETLPRLLEQRPGLPVIMSSGYSDHEIAPLLEGRPTVTSIRKPFSLKEFQAKICELNLQVNLEG